MFNFLPTWASIKSKFKAVFGDVASIITARITMLTGLVTGAIGALDWSPLLNVLGTSTDFNQKQVIVMGGIMFVKGLFDEFARRINDPLLKMQAAVAAAPEVDAAKEAVKEVVAQTPVTPVQ